MQIHINFHLPLWCHYTSFQHLEDVGVWSLTNNRNFKRSQNSNINDMTQIIPNIFTEISLGCCLHRWMDRWMTCDFTYILTVFRSYQDDRWVIIKSCVQCKKTTTSSRFRALDSYISRPARKATMLPSPRFASKITKTFVHQSCAVQL